jgi:flagellar motor component MotA
MRDIQREGNLMKLIAALLGSGLFLAAMALGGSIMMFVNIPSILIVFGGTLAFSLTHHSPSELSSAFSAAFSRTNTSVKNTTRHLAVLSTVRKTLYGSGLSGVLIGLIQMLHNLEDPSRIGPAMAVALLCSLYCVFLAEMGIAPLHNRIVARLEDIESKPIRPVNGFPAVMGFVCSSVIIMSVMLLSFQL